ncbi:MAG: hypothetical protein QHJ82_09595 [Verrucomicrobiota bacterium]|nr:hypothetical protein [Verrucomicrobiota bacterium]
MIATAGVLFAGKRKVRERPPYFGQCDMGMNDRAVRWLVWRVVQSLAVALWIAQWLQIANAEGEFGQPNVRVSSVQGIQDWFGVEVISAEGPFGSAPYDDPDSILGMPATEFYDPLAELWGGAPVRRVKIVEGACYTDATRTRKLVTTFGDGASAVIRLGRAVRDDPAHPYGIDFIVFGNAFFPTIGFADDDSDLNALMLAGGCFCEPLKVSVSPGYVGRPGQSATDWRTWDWYTFDNGPYADSLFPTEAYWWDRTNRVWSDRLMDFLKPVNPVLGELFESAGVLGLSVADAIELYDGSGGGTGFDLRETGFEEIRYVRIEGGAGMVGGEIDAVAVVRPMQLGDSLTIAPANMGTEGAKLVFLKNDESGETAIEIDVKSVNEVARVSTARLEDFTVLPPIAAEMMIAVDLAVAPIISSEPVSFEADVTFHCDSRYSGDGEDLLLLGWVGSGWVSVDFSFDESRKTVAVKGLKELTRYLLVQVCGPRIAVASEPGRVVLGFPVMAGWFYTLERTADLKGWNAVWSAKPTEAKLVMVEDLVAPSGHAFYRVRVARGGGEQNQLEGTK